MTPLAEYLRWKDRARALVHRRLLHFNAFYGFSWKRVTIRRQRTRWGSCSSDGCLSFNYKLALLPPPLADYVVVHELCHLKELNHSPRFWALVARTLPDHRERRKALRSATMAAYEHATTE